MNGARVAHLLRNIARLHDELAEEFDPGDIAKDDIAQVPRCSFCGGLEDKQRPVVNGGSVAICDECIHLAGNALAERRTRDRRGEKIEGEASAVRGFSVAALQAIREKLRVTLVGDVDAVRRAAAQVTEPPTNGHSFVYFIRGASDHIKIGTAKHVPTRLADLQIGNAARLELLVAIPGAHALEAAFHKTFAHLNVSGEWFAAANELTDLILFFSSIQSESLAGASETE